MPAIWILEKDKEYAETAGYTVVSPSAVISTHLTEIIKKNASEILTRADVQQLIDNLKKEVNEIYVNDLMKELTTADVQQVMQNLLKERVSIRDLKTILDSIKLDDVFKNTQPENPCKYLNLPTFEIDFENLKKVKNGNNIKIESENLSDLILLYEQEIVAIGSVENSIFTVKKVFYEKN